MKRTVSILILPFLIILFIGFLSWCSREEDKDNNLDIKQDFFIETRSGEDLQNETIIEKVWQVWSTQDIQVSSQAWGRIINLPVVKWQRVSEGQLIAELQDISWNITLSSERANVWLERAIIQRDSSLLSLEKQIFDISVQIENTERSLQNLKNDREKNLLLLEDSVSSNNISDIESRSSLQLAQFDATLERLRFDYENRIISDAQTRQSFIDSFVSNENTLRVLIDNVIDFSDPIFSVTEKNRFSNSRFATFLWARDASQRLATENLLKELIELRTSTYFSDFRRDFIGKNLTDEEILYGFDILSEWYSLLRIFLPELNQTFINTVESAWQLSSNELQSWKTQTQWFQSSFSVSYNTYIGTQNQARAFLRTYKNAQESQMKSIKLQEGERDILIQNLESGSLNAEVGKDRALLNIDDQIASLESQLIQLKNTQETTQKNYEITERSLQNSIIEAEIWRRQSDFELSKLTIRSPISWVIEEVLIDLGQEIQIWTPIVSLLAQSSPQVQVSLSQYERDLIVLWQSVFVDIWPDRYNWIISTISEVADRNFNYWVSVVFSWAQQSLWSIAKVSFPVKNNDFLIPLRIVEAIGEWQGRIAIYKDGNIWSARIRLGRVFWDSIEVLSCSEDCWKLDIIWSDISNYNSNDFILKKQ